ncbi:MAG: cation diffusion facilitator family transporter [Oscillospiraceae bacterium]|nr:cation diffusion facilitator family transporter [Oscillospiraceae bacterium]
MMSDAAHSIIDLFSTTIAIIGIKIAGKKPDKEHPYGHERFEPVATIILSALVFATGILIGWAGFIRIFTGDYGEIIAFGLLALSAAVISIILKETLYWYVRAAAKKIDSSALLADAWHGRLDGLSSIGSFIGILGALLGFPMLDSIAAIIICLFILRAAITIFMDAIGKLTDQSCDDTIMEEMRKIILAQKSVEGIDELRTRLFGNRIYVDVEILVASSHSLIEAHDIAQNVHDTVEEHFPKVKHCMVHVNPI